MLRRSLTRLRPSTAWSLLHEQLLLVDSASAGAELASTSGRGSRGGGSDSPSASSFSFRRQRWRSSSFFTSATSSSTSSTSASSTSPNVDPHEVSKFDYDWWDPTGPAAPLHALNSARVKFIRACLEEKKKEKEKKATTAATKEKNNKAKTTHLQRLPLSGLRILDVGCGGGILSEPLARLGARVTGIDASAGGPEAATRHAAADPEVASRLCYFPSTSLEELLESENGAHAHAYDCVIASEVIEHVPDPSAFVRELEKALKKKDEDDEEESVVIISTLARTPRSWLAAIAGAEHLAGLLPVGTHDWNRFVNPEELAAMAEGAGLEMEAASGMEPEVSEDPGEAVAAVAAAAPALAVAVAEAARRSLLGGRGNEEKKSLGPHPAVGTLFGRMSWELTGDLGVNYIASFKRNKRK